MEVDQLVEGIRRDKQVGYGVNDNKVIKKNRCGGSSSKRKYSISRSRSKGRRNDGMPIALQTLYASCRDVFRGLGTVPPPSHVHKLRHILKYCSK